MFRLTSEARRAGSVSRPCKDPEIADREQAISDLDIAHVTRASTLLLQSLGKLRLLHLAQMGAHSCARLPPITTIWEPYTAFANAYFPATDHPS
jgi:hypothetical protein